MIETDADRKDTIMAVDLRHHERDYWEAAAAAYEAQCNIPWYGGPSHDPYGTSCELLKGHEGDHEGPDPFGADHTFRWSRAAGTRALLRRYE